MHVALFALPLILAGCLDADARHQTSNAGADGQPIVVQASAQSPTEAVELVRGNNAVGHRDIVGAKKVLPQAFADMEKDFNCGCKYTGKEIDLASCGSDALEVIMSGLQLNGTWGTTSERIVTSAKTAEKK